MRLRTKEDKMKGYEPLAWPSDSKLSKAEQEAVELQRRDLWRHGIRKEPQLTKLAFEFGATLSMLMAKKVKG
jgi:hypothetical protein